MHKTPTGLTSASCNRWAWAWVVPYSHVAGTSFQKAEIESWKARACNSESPKVADFIVTGNP